MTGNVRKFVYEKHEGLPRLAWCARLYKDRDVIEVKHGPWVETRKLCFFAGAWGDGFDQGKPDAAVACCATGARLQPDRIVFFTSTGVDDRLYLRWLTDELVISNSLIFLLVETGDAPVPGYLHYRELFWRFLQQGIQRNRRSIPTRRGRVHVYEACNLHVTPELWLDWRAKPQPPAPVDYDEYVALLRTHLQATLDNASDSTRIARYRALANVSRGYDGNAVAALARGCGVDEAVTFAEDRPGIPHPDDGTPVGRCLGFDVHRFSRWGFAPTAPFPEAEFAACPPGHLAHLAAMEVRLAGAITLSGFKGDGIFTTIRSLMLPDLCLTGRQSSGTTGVEFRLRVGCLDFPLLYTGWQHADSIFRISTSSEMQPWSIGGVSKLPLRAPHIGGVSKLRLRAPHIGGDYDRPIARRLVEEAGVPRDMFGQKKFAVAVRQAGKADFRPASWANFQDFVQGQRRTEDYRGVGLTPEALEEGLLFHWGFDCTRKRYEAAGR